MTAAELRERLARYDVMVARRHRRLALSLVVIIALPFAALPLVWAGRLSGRLMIGVWVGVLVELAAYIIRTHGHASEDAGLTCPHCLGAVEFAAPFALRSDVAYPLLPGDSSRFLCPYCRKPVVDDAAERSA